MDNFDSCKQELVRKKPAHGQHCHLQAGTCPLEARSWTTLPFVKQEVVH